MKYVTCDLFNNRITWQLIECVKKLRNNEMHHYSICMHAVWSIFFLIIWKSLLNKRQWIFYLLFLCMSLFLTTLIHIAKSSISFLSLSPSLPNSISQSLFFFSFSLHLFPSRLSLIVTRENKHNLHSSSFAYVVSFIY